MIKDRESTAIESRQPLGSSDPEVTIAAQMQCADPVGGKAVLHGPAVDFPTVVGNRCPRGNGCDLGPGSIPDRSASEQGGRTLQIDFGIGGNGGAVPTETPDGHLRTHRKRETHQWAQCEDQQEQGMW